MWCKQSETGIIELVNHQLKNWWNVQLSEGTQECVRMALFRSEKAFSKSKSKYFWHEGEVAFHTENSVQYAIFLYMLSNSLYKAGFTEDASYVYYLNKIMHSIDWFYAVELPEYFGAEHPLSSVLGRASYGNYLFIYQGVTVGGNRKGDKIFYPQIGENVLLYSDSKVIGNSKIGNNVIVSAGCYIKDTDIPDNSIVYQGGVSYELVIKEKKPEEIVAMTNHIWKH